MFPKGFFWGWLHACAVLELIVLWMGREKFAGYVISGDLIPDWVCFVLSVVIIWIAMTKYTQSIVKRQKTIREIKEFMNKEGK